MQDLKITLRFDVSTEEKVSILTDAARQAAKHLFTSASLLSDRRPPEIALEMDNFWEGKEKISLAEDLE